MVTRTLPGLGLTGGFIDGEDGWGDAMNANLLTTSVVAGAFVLGRVAAVPAAPKQGDIYILTTDDTLAVYDNAAWVYLPPVAGWLFYDRAAKVNVQYDGTDWVELQAGEGGGGGIPDAPMDGKPYVRQNGKWVEFTGGSVTPPDRDTPARYRVQSRANTPDGYMMMADMIFRRGGADIPVDKTKAFASSQYDGNNGAPNAFDNNISTTWTSNGNAANSFIGAVDPTLSAVLPDEVLITAVNNQGARVPRSFVVQYSTDNGATWIDIFSVVNAPVMGSGEVRSFKKE